MGSFVLLLNNSIFLTVFYLMFNLSFLFLSGILTYLFGHAPPIKEYAHKNQTLDSNLHNLNGDLHGHPSSYYFEVI